MPNSKDFVAQFGSFAFSQRPFCEGDALALCQMFYMPLEQVVSSDFQEPPVNYITAASRLFAERGGEHKPLGLMITKNPSKIMMQMASVKRYAEMQVVAVQEVFSVSPAVQFCAGTFVLPDGTLAVCFRGTDDTVAGWKEDADMLVKYGTPSYGLAIEYITNLAEAYGGNIILCGHSKGGNIALYTALKCKSEIRNRIKGVYNFDGPGFYDATLFQTKEYEEILAGYHHFVPKDSFIGVLLCHDDDYIAVKSSRLLGPLQHDLGTWQFENGELIEVEDNDTLSKIVDACFAKLVEMLGTENYDAFDAVVTAVAEGLGQRTLTEVAENAGNAIKGAKEAYRQLAPEVTQRLHSAFAGGGKMLLQCVKNTAFPKKEVFNKKVLVSA